MWRRERLTKRLQTHIPVEWRRLIQERRWINLQRAIQTELDSVGSSVCIPKTMKLITRFDLKVHAEQSVRNAACHGPRKALKAWLKHFEDTNKSPCNEALYEAIKRGCKMRLFSCCWKRGTESIFRGCVERAQYELRVVGRLQNRTRVQLTRSIEWFPLYRLPTDSVCTLHLCVNLVLQEDPLSAELTNFCARQWTSADVCQVFQSLVKGKQRSRPLLLSPTSEVLLRLILHFSRLPPSSWVAYSDILDVKKLEVEGFFFLAENKQKTTTPRTKKCLIDLCAT